MSDFEATRHLAYALMMFADYLDRSKEVVPVIIYTAERWAVSNTERDAPLWMNSVVTQTIIYHGLYSTLSLDLYAKREYNGPIVRASWEWVWNLFFFSF